MLRRCTFKGLLGSARAVACGPAAWTAARDGSTLAFKGNPSKAQRSVFRQSYEMKMSYSVHVDPKDLTVEGISSMMHDMQYSSGDESALLNMLPILAERLDECAERFTSTDISIACFGLQAIESDTLESHAILTSLNNKIAACKEDWRLLDIGMTSFGLQGMKSDIPAVRSIFGSLAERLAENSEQMTAEVLADLICGMRSMNWEHKEVQEYLSVVSKKAKKVTGSVSGPQLEVVALGMKGMNSRLESVQHLLEVITRLWNECDYSLSEECIIDGLKSFRNMRSCDPGVEGFIRALNVSYLRHCQETGGPMQLETAAAADVMSSFGGLNSDSEAVRAMLAALLPMMKDINREEINSEWVSRFLSGFTCLNSNHAEVKALVSFVVDKVSSLSISMSREEVDKISKENLTHLTPMHPEVLQLLSMLHYKIEK